MKKQYAKSNYKNQNVNFEFQEYGFESVSKSSMTFKVRFKVIVTLI